MASVTLPWISVEGIVMLEKWSEKYDSCVECGTTERVHKGKGLCKLCHSRAFYIRRKNNPVLNDGIERKLYTRYLWSVDYEKCVGCGTSTVPYRSQGYCNDCWIVSKPSRKYDEVHSTYVRGNRRCSFCFQRFVVGERLIDTIGIDDRVDVFHERCWDKSFDAKFDTTAPLEQHEPVEVSKGTSSQHQKTS